MFRFLKSRKGSTVEIERGDKIAELTYRRDAQRLETERTQDRMKQYRIFLWLDDGEGNIPPITKMILRGIYTVVLAKVTGIGNLAPLLQALLGGQ
jgi:hypothetical protein